MGDQGWQRDPYGKWEGGELRYAVGTIELKVPLNPMNGKIEVDTASWWRAKWAEFWIGWRVLFKFLFTYEHRTVITITYRK